MKYWPILILLFVACKNKPFVQPEIIVKGAGFDLAQLTFKEDAQKLISKSLDSSKFINANGDFQLYLYPTEKQLTRFANQKQVTYLKEKRYKFAFLEQDSIAQIVGTFCNQLEIETDSSYAIKSFRATAKVYNINDLDSTLHRLYQKYGKTVWMKKTEKERGLQSITNVYDSLGTMVRKTTYKPYDIDYEAYLYEYKIDYDKDYNQWNLEDRVLQIEISNGSESIADFTTGKVERKKYHSIEFLFLLNKEYNAIKNRLIERSTEVNYPNRIIKPYYIESLDFYKHFNYYLVDENKNGKVYDFTR